MIALTIFQDAKAQATGAGLVTKTLLENQPAQAFNWVPDKVVTAENVAAIAAAC